MTKQTRRTAIQTIGAAFASLTFPVPSFGNGKDSRKPIKLGVIADLHGGLAEDADSRLDAFLKAMESAECDALIQLGDFAYPNNEHQNFADKFNAAHKSTIHVVGNHDLDHGLSKADCQNAWGIESSYYRKDIADLRVIVLDGNEHGSPTYKGGYHSFIGKGQQEWLRRELRAADRPVVVLSHQPIAGFSSLDNATDIQKLLASFAEKIVVCLNGHSHVDSMVQIGGVNYLHINSASYYWVGGKTRMAFYADPLYSTITVDLEKSIVSVKGKVSQWKGDSPKKLGYFDRENSPPEEIVTPQIRSRQIEDVQNKREKENQAHEKATTFKLMTWNIWGKLNQDPRYTVDGKTARKRTIEIIRESGADVVAMIETYGSAADIAKELGFHYRTPADDANLCIFSRYPLADIELLKGLSPFSFIAATVTLPNDQKIRVYDIWLTSSGRHIVEIKNKNTSDQEFCSGDDVRFDHLKKLLVHDDFKKDLENADAVPVIVAGDFNCVSHLDYTNSTRHEALNHSRVLPIKVSKAMQDAGFVDTFRAVNVDIKSDTLGHTWTTVGEGYVYESGKGFVPTKNHPRPEYRDPFARIDYIYVSGRHLKVVASEVIAQHPSQTKRSFPEFPSDHAAVLTQFEFRR